jgi:hypothetical protein
LASKLFRALQDYRIRTGRPHWLVVDEAHYPIPASWKPVDELHLEEFHSVMYVTAFVDKLPESILRSIDLFVAIGEDPQELLKTYCGLLNQPVPKMPPPHVGPQHRAIAWWPKSSSPFWLRRKQSQAEHQRHQHQYFDGSMDPADQFYFRGPENKLNLAAPNLRTFMQLAEGVDAETWMFHLRRGDYAHWFRNSIQDTELAGLAEKLQRDDDVTSVESLKQILELIRKLYVKEI